jgi:hypothetical protein
VFEGRSEWEIKLAAEETRQYDKRGQQAVSERSLREWLTRLDTSEQLLRQRMLDREKSAASGVTRPAPGALATQQDLADEGPMLVDQPLVDYGEAQP